MNILYVHQYFSTPAGSSGMRSYEFARALVGRGHRVTIVCCRYDGSITGLEDVPYTHGRRSGIVDGIHVIELEIQYSNLQSLFSRALVFLKYALTAIRFACFGSFDMVFATSTPLTAAIPGIANRFIRNRPFIFEVRDLWPELPRAMGVIKNPIILGLMSLLEHLAYRCSDHIIVLAPGMAESISRHGIEPSRIHLIPNGCDKELFSPNKRAELAVPAVPSGNFSAIFCGTIGMANGIEAVLDCAATLKKMNRDDISIILIGRGNRRAQLKERAEREQLSNCNFLEPVAKTELATLVASCDAGLMILADVPAFYYGTSPNKFFDYIASGIPVITNYPGWIADMISSSKSGIAVPPGNPQAFAEALCSLADNKSLRAEMGISAAGLSDEFNRSVLAQKFCDVIELETTRTNI